LAVNKTGQEILLCGTKKMFTESYHWTLSCHNSVQFKPSHTKDKVISVLN